MSKNPNLPTAVRRALSPTIKLLRGIARYKLEPMIRRRMKKLGERKEFLGKEEHDELLALVSFSNRRMIEKVKAELALQRLSEVIPEVAKNR